MYECFCLCVCMCIMCVLNAQRGQKKASNPLKLESWMVMSYHACAGNQIQVHAKAASALDHWAISLAFPSCFFDNLSSPWKLCFINALLQWFGELWTLKSSEEHPSSVADATNPSSCVVLSAPHTCHQHLPDTARSSFSGVFLGQSLGGSEPSAVCSSMARKKDGACLRIDGWKLSKINK